MVLWSYYSSGPGEIDQAHQPDEYLALDRLTPMIDILNQLVNTVCIKTESLI